MKIRITVIGIFMHLLFIAAIASASFLEDEAGISASTHVTNVNLSQAETAFKNIEKKTASYIIGSVAIDGYDESYDVHVYVDASGDMIAYYLKSEPASKIIDWINYTGGPMTLEGCNLEDALTKVCNAMFKNLTEVNYYDFRLPESQNIKIIIDEETVSGLVETFNIMIPDSYVVYGQSWSHACYRSRHTCQLRIDGNVLNTNDHGESEYWNIYEGEIPISFVLIPNIYHEVQVAHWDNVGGAISYGAIVLIYNDAP